MITGMGTWIIKSDTEPRTFFFNVIKIIIIKYKSSTKRQAYQERGDLRVSRVEKLLMFCLSRPADAVMNEMTR